MTDWTGPDAVDRLLFDGEEVTLDLPIGTNGSEDRSERVVVTTHRLLAFTPGGDGPNVSYADLPNVEGVEIDTSGRGWLVGIGVRALVIGGFLLVAGLSVDFGGMFGPISVDGAEQVGVGGMLTAFDLLRTSAALLDDALLAVGAGGVLLGALAVGGYVVTRQRELVVRVAGGSDIRVRGADMDSETVERIRRAVA